LEKLEEDGQPSLSQSSYHISLQYKRDEGFGNLGFPKIRVAKIRPNSKIFDAIEWGLLLKICQLLLG